MTKHELLHWQLYQLAPCHSLGTYLHGILQDVVRPRVVGDALHVGVGSPQQRNGRMVRDHIAVAVPRAEVMVHSLVGRAQSFTLQLYIHREHVLAGTLVAAAWLINLQYTHIAQQHM